jgi:hypothetical protein
MPNQSEGIEEDRVKGSSPGYLTRLVAQKPCANGLDRVERFHFVNRLGEE